MLKYNETMEKIHSLEKSLNKVNENTTDCQNEYREHLKRLHAAYVKEHRKAAEREGEYAMR